MAHIVTEVSGFSTYCTFCHDVAPPRTLLDLSLIHIYGKLGVESAANFNLLRSNSFFLERIVNEIRGEKNTGDDVVTTLNVSLQPVSYTHLRKL